MFLLCCCCYLYIFPAQNVFYENDCILPKQNPMHISSLLLTSRSMIIKHLQDICPSHGSCSHTIKQEITLSQGLHIQAGVVSFTAAMQLNLIKFSCGHNAIWILLTWLRGIYETISSTNVTSLTDCVKYGPPL